jgi:glycosyltransferase involved in cell wall biosynthesis/O-antigen/teichoic acid export membrane protein
MIAAAPVDPQVSPKRSTGFIFRKGFWAIADQGLFAGSNAIVYLLLARWLSPTEYGAFATGFASFMALGVIHTALLTEPMLVFSSERFGDQHKQYFGALLWGHLIVSVAASLVLVLTGWILAVNGLHDLARAMFAFAGAGPFILLLWLMRRTCYGQMNPRRAAISGLLYLVLMLAALFTVHATGRLGVTSAMVMIGLCSLIVSVWLGIGQVDLRPSAAVVRDVIAEHLRYGRWATATQILGFIPGNVYYFILPKMTSLADSGALRAMSNLFNPLMQANSALFLLLLPAFVRTRGTPDGRRLHWAALGVLAGGPLIYWLILGSFHHEVIQLVYGGKYQEYSGLIWLIGMQPVIAGMCGVYGSLLRARQQLNAVLWGGIVSAAGAVTFGIVLTHRYGLTGVCWSIAITYGLHHITLWLFSRWGDPATRRAKQDSQSLRVLFLHRDLPIHGGVPRCLLNLARAADRRRMNMFVASFVAPAEDMKNQFAEIGVQTSCIGDRGYFSPARKLRQVISRNDLDVVVATSFKAYICAKWAARRRAGVVFWHHAIGGTAEGSLRRFIRNAIGRHDPMLFVSGAVRDVFLSPNHRGPAEVIYNGVAECPDPPYGREMLPSFGVPPDALVLAFVGEFVPWKDHKTAVEAMQNLVRRGLPAHLLLIGAGRDIEITRKLAASGAAADRIHFLGSRADARRLLGLADIYIHPGRGEGFGLAVVEAMLAGRSVIAARDGALVEIIDPEKTGLLFNPGNAGDLADAITRLAADRQLAQNLATAGRESCLARFSSEKFAGGITSFLEKSFTTRVSETEATPALVGDLCAS